MSSVKKLKPTNRHLLVVPHDSARTPDHPLGFELPDDFFKDDTRYIEATVVDVAEDCSNQFKKLRYDKFENPVVVIDKTMLNEVKIGEVTHHLILENYVMGMYRKPNAP